MCRLRRRDRTGSCFLLLGTGIHGGTLVKTGETEEQSNILEVGIHLSQNGYGIRSLGFRRFSICAYFGVQGFRGLGIGV